MANPQTSGWRVNKERSMINSIHISNLLISLDHSGEVRILKNRWGNIDNIDLHLLLEIFTQSLRTRVIGCNVKNFNIFKVAIEEELKERVEYFKSEDKLLEAQRISERTNFDIEMMKETGFCSGIENYSRHLSGLKPGQPL